VKQLQSMVRSGLMRRHFAFSVRGVATCLAVWAGCLGACGGRQTFDLLQDSGGAAGASGLSGASPGGGGGSSGMAGSGGRPGLPLDGGAGGNAPCFTNTGEPCSFGAACPAGVAYCKVCTNNNGCPPFASHCDVNLGRCVQCRRNEDCDIGEACNTLAHTCARQCSPSNVNDCLGNTIEPFCHPTLNVCVGCNSNSDCALNMLGDRCFYTTCVQCFDSSQCESQEECVAGHCQKQH